VIRVGVNARALAKPDPAGVSQYTHALLDALVERSTGGIDADFQFLLFGLDALPEAFAEYDHVRNMDEPAASHSGLGAYYWEQSVLPRALRRYDLDAFHTPAGQPPIVAGVSNVPLVTTIHDISPITHPEWFSRSYAAVHRALTPLAVRTSDHIVTVSQFARKEIVNRYPNAAGKITAIHNGVTPPADPGTQVAGLQPDRYLLFVGAVNRRKNVRTLLEAYRWYRARTSDSVKLALAGPDRDVFADLAYEVPSGVETLGYVSDEELGWLYRNAAVFVFPSLYEGFGLPIVEAMHAGTPIVTSDRGAMAEVAGDAAVLVDPLDAEALAKSIERVLSKETHRRDLIARGHERATAFTWERAAARTAEVYRTIAGR
jgi:glycosyltransferase involved in cell wall biosynthesis